MKINLKNSFLKTNSGLAVLFVLFYACACPAPLYAQSLHPLSPSLTGLDPNAVFLLTNATRPDVRDKHTTTSPSVIEIRRQNDGSALLSAEVFLPSKSHYDVQAQWKNAAPVKRGDVLLARFVIRSLYAKQESGEAVVYFFVQQAAPPYDKSVIVDLSVGAEWKTVDIPFKASQDLQTSEAAICFSFGALPQKVEIASVQVLNFEQKAKLEDLPVTKFTYQGREEGAAWRAEALQRIEKLRTAPLAIKVVDAAGKPVAGATVNAVMLQSDFIWGTAVNEAQLAKDPDDTTAKGYRTVLKEFFNTAVIENGFKGGAWSNQSRRQETLKAFQWLQANNFRQRGHNLVWPAWKFNAALYKATAEKDTAAFRKLIEADILQRMAITKGKVIAWDVINELVHEKEFFSYLPKDAPVQWFKLAKSLDPTAQLFINEYGMLNSIASPKNIEEYIALVQDLRRQGAPIEALGIQGHVGRQPRNPAQVIKDLDLITPLGLPVQITEFDINSPDEGLQADYTRDFLIACYSHPAITGFTNWGFWQGAHWKPDAAMFRKDWSAKPSAAMWREWVTKKWKTVLEASTDNKGEVKSRGHLGTYEITVAKGSKVTKQIVHLTKTMNELKFELK